MEYSSQDIKALAQALIAVQRDMSPATKDSTNSFCKNRYASLNAVMDSCRDALLKHNIWLTQLPVPAPAEYGENHIALLTKLTHADSGQWQASLTVAPLPKNDPQGMGSAITYCRRYALTAMLGMVTEDDDGEAACIDGQNEQKICSKIASHARRATNAPQTQKGPQHNITQGDVQKNALKSKYEGVENLPNLEGITYEVVSAQDGRACIIATGNTQTKKEILMGIGFRWNAQRKIWWKYADAA